MADAQRDEDAHRDAQLVEHDEAAAVAGGAHLSDVHLLRQTAQGGSTRKAVRRRRIALRRLRDFPVARGKGAGVVSRRSDGGGDAESDAWERRRTAPWIDL